MYKKLHIYHVAYGGNVETRFGSPLQTMKMALQELEKLPGRITNQSPIYKTPAFPAGSGPDFANGVFSLESELSPEQLIAALHSVEMSFGRERLTRWGARTLDLDILACDDNILPNKDIWFEWHDLPLDQQMKTSPDQLVLPHPRLHERAFVLVPFADVAPNWYHPVLSKTVAEMRDDLPESLKNEVKPL